MRMNRNRSWNRMNGSMDRRLDWNMDSNNIDNSDWPERCVRSRSNSNQCIRSVNF